MRYLEKAAGLCIILSVIVGCGRSPDIPTVVVYTSLDQIYSEPIFKTFEEGTGIRVQPVYDTEAVKSVGLVRRIISESNNPQCDVFWNNEIARTIVLKRMGLLEPIPGVSRDSGDSIFVDDEGYWRGFAARLRVLVYNTNLLDEESAPCSIQDFVDPRWKGKLVIGYPLFGTTEIHFAALKTLWGEKADAFFSALKENNVGVVDGNAQVVARVAAGEYLAGLTDTDDVFSAQKQGKPVDMIFLDQDGLGSLLIPNTAVIIKNCPHPEQAKALITYLIGESAQQMLADSPSAQIPITDRAAFDKSAFKGREITVTDIDYEAVADNMEATRELLKKIFVR